MLKKRKRRLERSQPKNLLLQTFVNIPPAPEPCRVDAYHGGRVSLRQPCSWSARHRYHPRDAAASQCRCQASPDGLWREWVTWWVQQLLYSGGLEKDGRETKGTAVLLQFVQRET